MTTVPWGPTPSFGCDQNGDRPEHEPEAPHMSTPPNGDQNFVKAQPRHGRVTLLRVNLVGISAV